MQGAGETVALFAGTLTAVLLSEQPEDCKPWWQEPHAMMCAGHTPDIELECVQHVAC
jgi:hypothetical protein